MRSGRNNQDYDHRPREKIGQTILAIMILNKKRSEVCAREFLQNE